MPLWYPYDVFVSYRWVSPDQHWVREQLEPALTGSGLRVFLDVNDFVPGRDLILEMTRAGAESARALCVLSPDYFEGNRMVSFESLMARRRDPSGAESCLIPLVLRRTDIPEWMRGLVHVDWTDESGRAREWRKLLTVQVPLVLKSHRPTALMRSVTSVLSRRRRSFPLGL
jgi:hypothetical protein